MTTRTTNTDLHGGPLRAALNAYEAEMARRASTRAADAIDGDGLAPARGVCLGALLGARLWCLIGAAVCAAVGR